MSEETKKEKSSTKYAKAVHRLLDEVDVPKEVEINGETILIRKPDEYRHLRLLTALANNLLDEFDFIVMLTRLAVDGDLDQTQATKLLTMDKERKITAVLAEYGKNFEGFMGEDSAEAGETEEADGDF